MTEKWIRSLLEGRGEIEEVRVKDGGHYRHGKKFCYIVFSDPQDAFQVIKDLNGIS